MSTVKEEIAKNLLFYRKKAGLTQKQFADMLGVKNTAVSNWESGNNSIDIETLFAACEVFGVTLNDMYGKYSTDSCSSVQDLPADESQLLATYRALNNQGKEYILQTLNMAAQVYIKSDSATNMETKIG